MVDREAIARYGLNVEDVQRVVATAVGGGAAGQIFEGVARYDIMVRYAAESRRGKAEIAAILVAAPGGVRVPLSELARIEEVTGPQQILREQNQRFVRVQCNVRGRDIGSFVAEARALVERQVSLPPGYLVSWGGQFELQEQANRRLLLVVPATLLLVFLLLYGSTRSLGTAGLVMLNVPLALVGGVLALRLAGEHFSVPAAVGFIALFGIAIENAMVLVACIGNLRREGLAAGEAAIRGARLRLRAVLMTAATTAFGLVPLLFSSGTGSEVQRPLALVVLGGLVTANLLTLLVIPTLYVWFAGDRAVRAGELPAAEQPDPGWRSDR